MQRYPQGYLTINMMNSRVDDNFYLSINKDELGKLPQAHFNGQIKVIDKEHLIAPAIERLREYTIIGFDTETRPSFKRGRTNNVALLQLSCEDTCFLFRLNDIGFTVELRSLLEDENILKVGASVHDDFLNLNKLNEFKPNNFVDIQQFVKQFRIEDNSLARIYGIMFGERISKNQRLTNWEQPTLTQGQQEYAALDAYACTQIYNYLIEGNFHPENSIYKKYPESPSIS